MNTLTPPQTTSFFDVKSGCIRPHWEAGLNFEPPPSLTPFTPLYKTNPSILIHCHVHYTTLLPELIASWQHIPNRAILITTSNRFQEPIIARILQKLESSPSMIQTVPNLGRDIAPFIIECLSPLYSGFDLLVHCHTKRSVHSNSIFGQTWRRSLIESTFSPATSQLTLAQFCSTHAGLVFPWPHRYVAHNVNWGSNYLTCKNLMSQLNIQLPKYSYLYFPAGSFFWARPSVFSSLRHLNISYLDFEREPIPSDGSFAHAIERLIGLISLHSPLHSYVIWAGANTHSLPGPLSHHLIHLPKPSPQHLYDFFRSSLLNYLSIAP